MEQERDNDLQRILRKWEEIDKNSPYNVQLYGDEQFQGPVKTRKCTDLGYLLIFAALNCALGYVLFYAITQGDPARLSRGYDFRAEICGTGGLADKPYMYWPDPHTLEFPLCVDQCPDFYILEYICIYDVDHQSILQDRECSDALECTTYGFYCVPITESARRSVFDFLFEPSEIARRSLGDLTLAWDVPLLGCFVSLAVGFMYLSFYTQPSRFSLRFMHCFMWVTVAASGGMLLCVGLLFLQAYFVSYSTLCKGEYIDPEFCDEAYFSYYLVLAGLSVASAVVFGVVAYSNRKTIKLGVATIQITCSPIGSLKQLYLYPIMQVLIGGLVLVACILILLYVMSTGQVAIVENEDIPGGVAKTIEFTRDEVYMVVFSTVMLFWWLAFLSGVGEFILSAAVSTWFFQRERSTLHSPLLAGLKAVKYHLGSAVRGSLFNTIFKFPRYFMDKVKSCLMLLSDKRPGCADCLSVCCCCCCLSCSQKWLRFFTKYSYIFLALFGETYYIAAQKSYFLIKRNQERFYSPSKSGEFAVRILKLTIILSGVVTSFSVAVLANVTLSGQHTNELVAVSFLVFFTTVFCTYVAQTVAGAIQVCMNTTLLCSVCDEEMFVGEQRHIDNELQTFLDNIHEEQTEQHKEHRKLVRVSKPNQVYSETSSIDTRPRGGTKLDTLVNDVSEVGSSRPVELTAMRGAHGEEDEEDDEYAPVFALGNSKNHGDLREEDLDL